MYKGLTFNKPCSYKQHSSLKGLMLLTLPHITTVLVGYYLKQPKFIYIDKLAATTGVWVIVWPIGYM